jgi:site-specific DNA recombinase
MYAELKGWTVVELYDLSGVSGKSVSEHPEAQRMFADVASAKIGGLIFSKLARLARISCGWLRCHQERQLAL